jgi:hypothetical protein
MVLDDTMGTSSWLSHFNHPTHRSEFPMQHALAAEQAQVGEIRGGYLDHRTAGNAYPEEIRRINV